jgi:aspartate-semialdehyde dehydrogenase
MADNIHMSKQEIEQRYPNLHEAVYQMILDSEPESWKDVEMVLAWVGYSVQTSMEKSAEKACISLPR